jgi:hypothetical protein
MIDPDTREFLERTRTVKPEAPRVTVDPLLDSNVDIPLDRMAREFRKRAGRAFGLGDDIEAEDARVLCKAIEDFDRKFGRKGLSR